MNKKLNERIELSENLKLYLDKDDIIEIKNWKDIDGRGIDLNWKVIYVSIGKGPTSNHDYFCYEDVKSNRGVRLRRTFHSLSHILMNCESYKLD